jgi:hypothetical protein
MTTEAEHLLSFTVGLRKVATYIPRVPQCLPLVRIGTPPPPRPQASMFPPEPGGGGYTLASVCPNSDD